MRLKIPTVLTIIQNLLAFLPFFVSPPHFGDLSALTMCFPLKSPLYSQEGQRGLGHLVSWFHCSLMAFPKSFVAISFLQRSLWLRFLFPQWQGKNTFTFQDLVPRSQNGQVNQILTKWWNWNSERITLHIWLIRGQFTEIVPDIE